MRNDVEYEYTHKIINILSDAFSKLSDDFNFTWFDFDVKSLM